MESTARKTALVVKIKECRKMNGLVKAVVTVLPKTPIVMPCDNATALRMKVAWLLDLPRRNSFELKTRTSKKRRALTLKSCDFNQSMNVLQKTCSRVARVLDRKVCRPLSPRIIQKHQRSSNEESLCPSCSSRESPVKTKVRKTASTRRSTAARSTEECSTHLKVGGLVSTG